MTGIVYQIGDLLRFGEIEIPRELVEAIEQGRLVIFAGAGVSKCPPSNLPLFETLAELIGSGTTTPRERSKDIPIDRYLGTLESAGLDVRALTKKELSDDHSKPSPLHKSVCDIFGPSSKEIKIITTNFDLHFSTCLKEKGASVEEFHAPALPLGHTFEGLVYLHGSLAKPLDRMVITDSDFGRAYLIDGWATRFLKDVFSSFTVLFVGYSYDDPVMSYIARGLPPGQKRTRFILTHESENSRWGHLNIVPISFPIVTEENVFIRLQEGLDLWAKHLNETFMDKELKIQDIVSKSPPIDPETTDFILHSIEKDETFRFFSKYCKNEEWLIWIDQKGLLNRLFDPNAILTPTDQLLAQWTASSFSTENPYALIKIIQARSGNLHPNYWERIAFAIHHSRKDIDDRTFASWTALLFSKMNAAPHYNILEYLLRDCTPCAEPSPACQILSILLTPILNTDKGNFGTFLSKDAKETQIKVTLDAENIWLTQAWDKIFRNNLDHYGDRLFSMLLHNLEIAYSLHEIRGSGNYDSLSRRRPSISRHPQNHSEFDVFNSLFDFFADVLEWISKKRPHLSNQIMSWLCAPAPSV